MTTTITARDVQIRRIDNDKADCCTLGDCRKPGHAYAAVGFGNGYVDTCRDHAAEALADLINDGTLEPDVTCEHGLEYGLCKHDCAPSLAQALALDLAYEVETVAAGIVVLGCCADVHHGLGKHLGGPDCVKPRVPRAADDLTVSEIEAETRRLLPTAEVQTTSFSAHASGGKWHRKAGCGSVEVRLPNGVYATLSRSEYGLTLNLGTGRMIGHSADGGATVEQMGAALNDVLVALQNLAAIPGVR